MKFTTLLPTAADHWKLVKRAEQLGFSGAWFFDTQMLNADVFVAMAAAAMETSRIRLGTGVLIPSNRIAPVAANAFASLNKLAPGRIDFGVSTGFTARRAMGIGAMKLADVEEYIRIVRGLWARETVDWAFEGKTRKICFLNPELNLINLDDEIPVHVSAFGPKARQMTARLGANWIMPMSAIDRVKAAQEDMHKAWSEAGRDPKDFTSTVVVVGSVMRDGDSYDDPRVKEEAGPGVAMIFHDLVESAEVGGHLGFNVPPPFRPVLEKYQEFYRNYQPDDARYLENHRGHLMFLRPEEEPVITGDLIKHATLSGTVEELRDRIRQLGEMGFDQIAIRIMRESTLNDWAEVAEGL